MELGTKTLRREDLCSRYFMGLSMDVQGATRYVAFPLACKSWDCPDCRKKKAEGYRDRMQAINDGRKLYMLTLTYFHSMTPDESWSSYNDAWNRLRTNLSKQYGSFDYIRVLESHNNSPYPHLHIIIDKYVKPSILGPAAIAAGFGYQIKCKPITSEGAFHYVKKYLTKEWTNKEAWQYRKKNRCRLISFSRGLLSPIPPGSGWQPLVIGSDLECCIDCIRTDIHWRKHQRGEVTFKQAYDTYYEVTVEWRDLQDAHTNEEEKSWCPDDWVPK
jgi:hypothetical protein